MRISDWSSDVCSSDLFEQFQLNTFNGISFVVENVQSCKEALTPVVGASPNLGSCPGGTRPGVISKGIELEAGLFPTDDVAVTAGFTHADTEYRSRLVGSGGRTLPHPRAWGQGGRRVGDEGVWPGVDGWYP